MRALRTSLCLVLLAGLPAHAQDAAGVPAWSHADVLWRDNDDLPVPRPERDDDGDAIWWDGARNMTVYPASRVLDLGHSLHALGEVLGLAGPREAANRNAVDEAPSSSWFTNRHGLERVPAATLERGPNLGPPPDTARLTVLSGKTLGATPGFVMADAAGRRYLVKPDAAAYPGLATGAELVASKLVWAAGWNVPEYHLVRIDPARLALAEDATTRDSYNRKRPMRAADLEAILAKAAIGADGRMRAVASRFVDGVPIGPPAFEGRREDDPNDTVDHEDRRDLRGLRVVSAWLNLTDTRRGNFLDAWLPHGEGADRGHVVHWVLDFSSAFGAANVGYKPVTFGHEYLFDPGTVATSLVAGGLWVKPAERTPEPVHRELGPFVDVPFDPDRWRPTYPNPLYGAATELDDFWGAKLVTAFTDADLARVVATGAWSSREAEQALLRELIARRDTIARRYLGGEQVNPADRFRVEGDALVFEDLAVTRAGRDAERASYRYRIDDGEWHRVRAAALPLEGASGESVVTLQSFHGVPPIKGEPHWGPETRVTIRDGAIAAIERDTR